jgi:hypothetical protein
MTTQRPLSESLDQVAAALAGLRAAASELPVVQRHLFLQAVGRLERDFAQLAGLFEPVEVT